MTIKRTVFRCAAAFMTAIVLFGASVPAFAYCSDEGNAPYSKSNTDIDEQSNISSIQVGTIGTPSGKRLNLRKEPSMDGKIIGRISNGSTVTILDQDGEWYEVSYDGKTGYVYAEYVTVAKETVPETTEEPNTEVNPEPTVEPTPIQTPAPLTPDGNMDLVDDVEQEAEGKQFLTVQTRNNNTFYIIIDRDKETENVYFLNLVDESDLNALLDDGEEETPVCTCKAHCEAGNVDTSCPICKNTLSGCTGVIIPTPAPIATPEPTPTAEPVTTESKASVLSPSALLILLLCLIGIGGAIYYVKSGRKKSKSKNPIDLDDIDFGDDETEYVSEDDEE